MGRPDFRQQPAGVKVSKTASNFLRLPASPGPTQGMSRGEPRWDTTADLQTLCPAPAGPVPGPARPDFEHISPSIRASLVPAGTIPAGTEIYREDTAAEAVHTIRRGIVKLIKQTRARKRASSCAFSAAACFHPRCNGPSLINSTICRPATRLTRITQSTSLRGT